MAESHESSPEAAGIFRVFQPVADPVQAATAETTTDESDPVPLPRRRPATSAALIGARDPDACGFQPLVGDSSFRQKLRDNDLHPYCRALPALL